MRGPIVVLLAMALAGCGFIGRPLRQDDLDQVRTGARALLLLRLIGTDQHGTTRQPLIGSFSADPIGTGWGDFESGGKPLAWLPRSPSDAAWAEGWVNMALAPGYYYLAILPARRTDAFTYAAMLDRAPRWRIEVPAGVPVIYAGTLALAERTEPGLLSTLWVGIDYDRSEVRDETAAATALAARDLPALPPPHTRLAVRQSGPIRLGVPPL
jgi:hypothetical protein